MSDRNDRKLEQVPVGSYNYRHEAEFAAGFLKSAGIPYRLQIEDPTLGLSASESATLWVHAMDERRAREVLDQEEILQDEGDGEPLGEDRRPEEDAPAEGDALAGDEPSGAAGYSSTPSERVDAATADTSPDGRRRPPGAAGIVERGSGAGTDLKANAKPDLTLRERILAIVAGLGISSLMGVDAVLEAHPAIPWTVAIAAVALVLAGVLGRAPGPLKALLSTFSGDAS